MLLIQKGVIKHFHGFFHSQPACLGFSGYWSSSELKWYIVGFPGLDWTSCFVHVHGEAGTAPTLSYLNSIQGNLRLYVDQVFSLHNLLQTP